MAKHAASISEEPTAVVDASALQALELKLDLQTMKIAELTEWVKRMVRKGRQG